MSDVVTLKIAELQALGDQFQADGDAEPIPQNKLVNYMIASQYRTTAALVHWLFHLHEDVRWQGRTGRETIDP